MRILLVDDEYKTRESLGKLILRLFPDFQIIGEASDGLEGARLISAYLPDLVITDIKMPKMDGLKMIENTYPFCPETRYLVLSGYAEFEYAQKAIRLSVVDYLLKPVNIGQLKDTLTQIQKKLFPPNPDQSTVPDTKITANSNFVSYVLKDISVNYARKLYLEEYAKLFHITPEYASNLFAKETSMNFSSYLKKFRIEKAKNLMANTDLKIYEIALRTGYSDAKYFCRVFKEITGQSPSSYLRNRVY